MKTLFLKINNEISMKKMRCGDNIVFVYLLFALNIQLSIYFKLNKLMPSSNPDENNIYKEKYIN